MTRDEMIDFMLANEGGYVLTNDPDDPGGMTYAGISQRAWPNWAGWSYIVNKLKVPDHYVHKFYIDQFWNKLRCDLINSPAVQLCLFDFSVNVGVKRAAQLMQTRVDCLPIDGIIGPKTAARINQKNPHMLCIEYSNTKEEYYLRICKKNATLNKYLRGWRNRINHTLEKCSKLI